MLLERFSLLFYFESGEKLGQYLFEPLKPLPLRFSRCSSHCAGLSQETKSGSQLHNSLERGSAEFRVLPLADVGLHNLKKLGREVIIYWKVHLEPVDNFLLSGCSKSNNGTVVNGITWKRGHTVQKHRKQSLMVIELDNLI